jgi:tetratricopeptide (TPR) repeat protein
MALCQDWGAITNYLGDEARAVYQRALALSRQLRFTPHLFTAYWGLHEIALYRGDYGESLELSEQCMHIAQEMGDPGMLLQAHHALWGTYHFSGRLREALDHMEAGLAFYHYPAHEALSPHYGAHDAASCALGTGALTLWHLGLLDQAIVRQQQLLRHADRLMEPANKADGYLGVAYLHHLLRAAALAQPYAETVLRIGVEHGYPGLRSGGEIVLGWCLAMQGRPEEGLALIEQGLASENAAGFQLNQSQKMLMLAEAYLVANRAEAAIATVEQGIEAFARSRDVVCAPDLWTLKGDALFIMRATDAEVAACYEAALALAQELDAKTSELRAAIRLASLRHCQELPADGAMALRQIYGWFTEGHDTPDLCMARATLERWGLRSSIERS